MIHTLAGLAIAAVLTTGAVAAAAQHGQHGQQGQHAQGDRHGGGRHDVAPTPAQPYAGHRHRSIKALSDEQIADLRAGRGAGFALAAELNGYPGPLHVLELAADLELTPEQMAATTALLAPMRSRAAAAGEKLIEAERALDALFANRSATPDTVRRGVDEVARWQAEVRSAHLLTHLEQVRILSDEQIRRYAQRRGYGH